MTRLSHTILFLFTLVLPPLGWADAGKVLYAVGEVTVERGASVTLTKGDPVREGDVIVTGSRGRIQLLMADGAKISVRAGSRFVIEKYQVPGETDSVIAVTKGDGEISLRLFKGGLRTITGAVGKGKNKDNYQLNTPVVTLGVRGTDYSIRHCDGDCEALSGEDTPSGTFARVNSGSIVLYNDAGQVLLNRNEVAYVSSRNVLPRDLLKPPSWLFDGEADFGVLQDGEVEGKAKKTADDEEEEEDSSREPDLGASAGAGTSFARLQGSLDESPGLPAASADDLLVDLDPTAEAELISYMAFGEDNVVGFRTGLVPPYQSDAEPVFLLPDGSGSGPMVPGEGTVELNTGADAVSGLQWGRWDKDFAGATQSAGSDRQIVHWIYESEPHSPEVVLPQSGTVSFNLMGNTNPTDSAGQSGVLGSATLDANFTDQTVTNTLNMEINGNTIYTHGVAEMSSGPIFSGPYDSVLTNGSGTGGGGFVGFFTGSGIAPSGAGVSYTIQAPASADGSVITINGTAAFGN